MWYTKNAKATTFNALEEPVKLAKPQPVTQKIGGKRIWLRDGQGIASTRKV